MTTTAKLDKPRKARKKPEPIYLVDNGDTFHGTLAQFKDCFFSNATEISMVEWAKQNNMKLQRRHFRGKTQVTTTLHDPAKPEKVKFERFKWGNRKGQKYRALTYTDSDGKDYTFWLQFSRDTRKSFDENGMMAHKHEIEYRLLEKLVKAINGEEEPD